MGEVLANKRTYSQVLEQLQIQPEHNKVITCKLCGELMHWLQINDYVGFWVHQDEAIAKCAKMNPMATGTPLIAQNMWYYKKIFELWKEKVESDGTRQNTRKR